MINIGAIRGKIIDLALQGKLSSHNDTDSNVDRLLREVFLKNGEKDNIPEKDFPFEIPKNWRWIKLGWVMNIDRGGSPRPIKAYITNEPNGINWIKIGDVAKDGKYITGTKEKIKPEGEKKSRRVYPGDFLLTNSMSFGRPYISKIEGCIHDGWLVLRNSENVFDLDFLYYLLSSTYAYSQFAQKASGSTVDNLNKEKVGNAIVPLPPMEEQRCIVDSIERIIPTLSIIDDLQNQYTSNMEALKSKLIDAAIQGKLTEQLPEDGTAEELYQKIQEVKQSLVKNGKIKRGKPLPESSEDEIPFGIPSNWKWVRISEVIDVRDGTHDSPKYHDKGIPLVTSKNISSGELSFDDVKLISTDDAQKINERSYVDDGDILFAMIGSIGNPVIVHKDRDFCIKNVALFKNFAPMYISMDYFYWFLMHEQFVLRKNAIGGLQPFVSLKVFRNHLMPLPPINEQIRIAGRLYELMDTISK